MSKKRRPTEEEDILKRTIRKLSTRLTEVQSSLDLNILQHRYRDRTETEMLNHCLINISEKEKGKALEERVLIITKENTFLIWADIRYGLTKQLFDDKCISDKGKILGKGVYHDENDFYLSLYHDPDKEPAIENLLRWTEIIYESAGFQVNHENFKNYAEIPKT